MSRSCFGACILQDDQQQCDSLCDATGKNPLARFTLDTAADAVRKLLPVTKQLTSGRVLLAPDRHVYLKQHVSRVFVLPEQLTSHF